ncbi:hypothetical protein B296_00043310 [Ensete ventricosum]|uniref:Uncharacterized protein n=1 Tax=Ensete ventricosum TaxID=4639 RepID=A0A426XK60_ENSVE|nr:hypothetical protein B296_00043310 [Ensete ventricosum]
MLPAKHNQRSLPSSVAAPPTHLPLSSSPTPATGRRHLSHYPRPFLLSCRSSRTPSARSSSPPSLAAGTCVPSLSSLPSPPCCRCNPLLQPPTHHRPPVHVVAALSLDCLFLCRPPQFLPSSSSPLAIPAISGCSRCNPLPQLPSHSHLQHSVAHTHTVTTSSLLFPFFHAPHLPPLPPVVGHCLPLFPAASFALLLPPTPSSPSVHSSIASASCCHSASVPLSLVSPPLPAASHFFFLAGPRCPHCPFPRTQTHAPDSIAKKEEN